jgi:hypothetical protein
VQVKHVVQAVFTGGSGDRVMADTRNPKTDPGPSLTCQIRVESHLGQQWADWFEGLTITLEDNGQTLLTGPVVDQAALHGLLKRVRDLGIPLLSVVCVKAGWAEAAEVNVAHQARSDEEN